jgi:hypothetical protein
MLSDADMYERMEKGWRGGITDGTLCGNSSTMQNTKAVRWWLPDIVERYGIKSVCDAGAGDLHWIKHITWSVPYRGFDLIPRHSDVKKLDITVDRLPDCDLILCRAVLNHLDEARIQMALRLFAESGKYLAATQFSVIDKVAREFMRLDLRKYLGNPIESIADTSGENSELALWKL